MEDILACGSWRCHSWENCPTHAAYGVGSIDALPPDKQRAAVKFIALFDGKLLAEPKP